MNRRAFLKTSGIAAFGLVALPIASASRLWSGTASAQSDEVEIDPATYNLNEEV